MTRTSRNRTLAATTALAAAALFSWAARTVAQPAATKAEDPIKLIRDQLPDQAHVMMDVGYHFSGVWLAGQQKNWPLARFYYDETRSHLHWAVRVRPVRKLSTGVELALGNILDALEAAGGPFEQLKTSIEQKDPKKFEPNYRAVLEGCYACHKASEKAYLHPKIPTHMGEIVNFDPAATWPQ